MSSHGRRGSFSCAEKVAVAEGADGACDGEGGPDDGYLMLIMKSGVGYGTYDGGCHEVEHETDAHDVDVGSWGR